jgi:hypothetical protein
MYRRNICSILILFRRRETSSRWEGRRVSRACSIVMLLLLRGAGRNALGLKAGAFRL